MGIARADRPWDDERAAACWPALRFPDSPLIIRGCIIRFESLAAGPYILADSSHKCVGVDRVQVTDGGVIEVYASDTTIGNVFYFGTSCDNDFAKAGFFMGPSGGAGRTVAEFTNRDGAFLHGLKAELYGGGRNINCVWLSLDPTKG
jgi:hypothetical protein